MRERVARAASAWAAEEAAAGEAAAEGGAEPDGFAARAGCARLIDFMAARKQLHERIAAAKPAHAAGALTWREHLAANVLHIDDAAGAADGGVADAAAAPMGGVSKRSRRAAGGEDADCDGAGGGSSGCGTLGFVGSAEPTVRSTEGLVSQYREMLSSVNSSRSKIDVMRSAIHNWGVFATKPISKASAPPTPRNTLPPRPARAPKRRPSLSRGATPSCRCALR